VNAADGPEEREFETEEQYEHELDAQAVDEAHADELRDLIFTICRPSCALIGHDRHLTKGHCRFCGIDL
jgi:predicted RNA polymerase sigma factor